MGPYVGGVNPPGVQAHPDVGRFLGKVSYFSLGFKKNCMFSRSRYELLVLEFFYWYQQHHFSLVFSDGCFFHTGIRCFLAVELKTAVFT